MDLVVTLGGDCLADMAVLRSSPELFGLVASDPTVSRLVGAFGGGPAEGRCGRSASRGRQHVGGSGRLARERAPSTGGVLIWVDLDATIEIVHSKKQAAVSPRKANVRITPDGRIHRFGAEGTGAAALWLRKGNAAPSPPATTALPDPWPATRSPLTCTDGSWPEPTPVADARVPHLGDRPPPELLIGAT
jgi:hypothetical protein